MYGGQDGDPGLLLPPQITQIKQMAQIASLSNGVWN